MLWSTFWGKLSRPAGFIEDLMVHKVDGKKSRAEERNLFPIFFSKVRSSSGGIFCGQVVWTWSESSRQGPLLFPPTSPVFLSPPFYRLIFPLCSSHISSFNYCNFLNRLDPPVKGSSWRQWGINVNGNSPKQCLFLLKLRCFNGVSWRTSTSERRSFQWKFMTPGGKFISQMESDVSLTFALV